MYRNRYHMTSHTQKIHLFLQYADKISSHKHVSLFVLFISILYTILFCNISYITDSYEYGIVASCWIDPNFIGMDCSQVNYLFRQPLPAILVVLSYPFLDPYIAIGFWAWASSSVLLWMIWYGGTKVFSNKLGYWLWLGFAISPFFRNLNTFADARVIVLPFVLWAGLSLLIKRNSKMFVFSGAICCVLAFLTRIEYLLILPIFIYVMLFVKRGSWSVTISFFTGTLICWMGCIWLQGNILSVSPRYWEGYLLQSTQVLPLRWSLDLFGMGIWSPKMRDVALNYSPISMSLDSFDFYDLLYWIQLSVISYFPIWSWFVLIGGLVHAFFNNGSFKKFLVFSSLMLPSVAVMILPQTRDHMFPHANTFIIWLVSLLGIIWSFDHISKMLSSKYNSICMLLLLSAHTFMSNATDLDSGLEFFPVSQKTTKWLKENTPENSIIISSYEVAPLVFRSNRRWEQWPTPMEWQLRLQTSHPVYVLVSKMDPYSIHPTAFVGWKEPVAYFTDQENDFLIVKLKP